MGKEVNFGKLLHGGDYNPEQWLDYPEILEQDLAYFKKARINEVSLGMFSWAFLEPEEGVFRLEWLKDRAGWRKNTRRCSVSMQRENGICTGSAIITAIPHRFTGKKRESSIRSWRKCSKITLA